jgi:2-C-methyl-D-erythritol 4-phosphate cytidylyltransferase
MPDTAAVIIAAAGSSRRMGEQDKLWTPLVGRITLARTIDVFEASTRIHAIILVSSARHIADAAMLCNAEGWRKIVTIVAGGPHRQDSVHNGLDALAEAAPGSEWVMIHDGARPLITDAILEVGLKTAQEHQAATAAVPVKDTVKQVQHGQITGTLDRSHLWLVQTPQVFTYSLIHRAHHLVDAQEEVTDDAALVERLGQRVVIFPGSYANIKITNQEDVLFAEALLQGQMAI